MNPEMNLEIKPIESKQEWEQFMEIQKPQTFLHSWGWGEFNEKNGSKIFRLGVFQENKTLNTKLKLIVAALILKIKAKRGTFLFCPHGPIFDQQVFTQQTSDQQTTKSKVMDLLTNELKKLAKKEKCDFIRISPLLLKNSENEKVFMDLGFRQSPIHMHSELAWILDITPNEEELLKNMRKTTRYCIKKADKDDVETIISSNPDDIEIFWKVYQETVDRQNFTPFSKKYLRTEFEVFQKDGNALFFFAKYNNEIVATAMIIFYQGSAFYHHGASTHQYPKIPAPYLLQWRIIQEAKKRGCRNYDFWGISPEDQPKHPWAGLSLFKKGFGGQAIPYVHAKDYPMSPKYWLSYLIEVVRKKKRGL